MTTEQLRTRAEAAALLRRRIDESGLSRRRFAVDLLIRQERTVRRWVSGESPIPHVVQDWLQGGPETWPRAPDYNPYRKED